MASHKSEPFRARDYLHPRYWSMWLFFALLRLAAFLPYRTQLTLGRKLGRLSRGLSAKRRRIVRTNLALCFPDLDAREREKLDHLSFENLGISIFELAMCWWWSEERLRPLVEIRGQENVQACLDRGQGVILLSGHFSSLEIGGRLLALFMPFAAMYRTQKNRLFDSLLYSKRQGYLEDVISRKNTRRMIKGIKNLTPTWYAPDQNFANERNVFAPFFGVPTATITASSRLAKSSGAAMVPFYPERKADNSGYILWLLPAMQDFPSGDDLADATAINATIEQFARKRPEQYMWVHQRFKTRPPGEPRLY
jgi:KDO2-lipid IV(A) lauroyltransferase